MSLVLTFYSFRSVFVIDLYQYDEHVNVCTKYLIHVSYYSWPMVEVPMNQWSRFLLTTGCGPNILNEKDPNRSRSDLSRSEFSTENVRIGRVPNRPRPELPIIWYK